MWSRAERVGAWDRRRRERAASALATALLLCTRSAAADPPSTNPPGAPSPAAAPVALPTAPPSSTGNVASPPTTDATLENRRARAAAAFSDGIEAYRRGQFATAAASFEEAYRALPDPAPLFNMARSWEGANEVVRAIDAYERYLVDAPNASDRAEVVDRINGLRARPAQVFITTEPPGAAIYLDEEPNAQPSRTPAVLRIPPGRHLVSLELPGYDRTNRSFVADPGESSTVAVQLSAAAPGSAPRAERTAVERRANGGLGARFAFQLGAARVWNGEPLALSLAGEASIFAWRYFTARLRFERVEPDGAWTFGTAEAGISFPLDDIDLGLALAAGVGHGWNRPNDRTAGVEPLTGAILAADARVDWQFHSWLSLGAFFRLGLRNLFVAPVESLNSFGLSLSLTL